MAPLITSLQAFSPLHVNNFFGIESHEDSPIEGMPGITMSKPGPLQVRSMLQPKHITILDVKLFSLFRSLWSLLCRKLWWKPGRPSERTGVGRWEHSSMVQSWEEHRGE